MLKILRKKGVAKKLLWAVAIVIIFSFGFFGTAYLVSDITIGNYAGKIFGRTITFEQWQKARQHKNIQALILYGENFRKIEPYLNLDKETWDRLILLHETKKRKIKVNDEEVIEQIGSYPFFQRDNQFDTLLYNDILRSFFRMRPKDFEEGVRDTIRIGKLYEQVTLPVTVSEDEVFEEFKKENEKVQVNYMLIETEKYKRDTPLDKSLLEQYFKEHSKEFLFPPSINIEYLHFELPKDADDAQKEEMNKKVVKVYDELFEDLEFEEVAQKNNLPVKETGFFNRQQPNLTLGWSFDVLQKAFELDENEISDPIKTDQGAYILRLKKKREAYVPQLQEVGDKVKEAVQLQAAKKVAQRQAQEYLDELKQKIMTGETDFQQFAKSKNIEVQQTPEFKRGEYLSNIGISKEFENAAFSLTEDDPISSEVVDTAKGYCILHFQNLIPADEKQFDVDKQAISIRLTAKKKNQTFNDFISRLRLKADLVDNITRLKEEQER